MVHCWHLLEKARNPEAETGCTDPCLGRFTLFSSEQMINSTHEPSPSFFFPASSTPRMADTVVVVWHRNGFFAFHVLEVLRCIGSVSTVKWTCVRDGSCASQVHTLQARSTRGTSFLILANNLIYAVFMQISEEHEVCFTVHIWVLF